jgi:phage baseplate assembly protein gpV
MSSGGPRSSTEATTLYGVYYGVVTQNKDEEKSLARIKVRFPWLDQGDKDQAHWAQLATPMSGDKFGWYTLPDVGDVVAVMFLGGDISSPVVLGGVWSRTDKPPEDNANGNGDFRGYRSRQGSRVLLDDSASSKVVLADKTNKNVAAVGAFGKGGDGPNASEPPKPPGAGDGGVTISAMDGAMQINCPNGTLKVSAKGIKINAKNGVDIAATGDLTLQGGSQATVGATGAGNFDGSQNKIN